MKFIRVRLRRMDGSEHMQGASVDAPSDKRLSPRVPFSSHLVVAWRDAAGLCETHQVGDMGFGGFRLIADRVIPVGRIGRAIHILPSRTAVDTDILVVWSLERSGGGCDIGVRLLDS